MKQLNSFSRTIYLVVGLMTVITLLALFSSVRSQSLKIIRENRRFYVLFPDSSKVEIVKEHEGGALNTTVLSPDSKYVFYTDATGIGFESSGKDLFYCRPDGTERTFLHKIYGSANNVNWIEKEGHNYIVFLEVYAGEGYGFIDVYDFDNRKMLLKIEGGVLKLAKNNNCFVIGKGAWKPEEWAEICLDSLLALGDPDKFQVEVYQGYGYPNELFLSTRRESFLNPTIYWPDIPNEKSVKSVYGGLGQSLPSPFGKRTAFWINMDAESWIGVLNHKTNKFQFMDSLATGRYKDNPVWSYDGDFLGFVESYPDSNQEIVVVNF